MRLVDEHGHELDAEFDLSPTPYGVDLVLHSRAGGSTVGRGRNTAYYPVLERILDRLSARSATILNVSVDSKVAQRLPPNERSIDLPYPLRLSPATDPTALRIRMTEGQRTVASNVADGHPGGNKHKRIRIAVDLSNTNLAAADVLRVLGATSELQSRPTLGLPYRQAKPNPSVRPADVFTYDPSSRERALAGHARVQNALAVFLDSHGHEARRPAPHEPDFDLAWVSDTLVVAEVKTLSGTDAVQQLRLGLGQVLHYRRALRELYGDAAAVLAVEFEPPTPWIRVCADVGVVLSWPPMWPGLPV